MPKRLLLFLTLGLSLTACYQGYARPEELDSAERGPKACAATCGDLGLEMSAFVLVDRATAGCVCSPKLASRADENKAEVEEGKGDTEPKDDADQKGDAEQKGPEEGGTEPAEGAGPTTAMPVKPDVRVALNSAGAAAAYVLILQQEAAAEQQAQQQAARQQTQQRATQQRTQQRAAQQRTQQRAAQQRAK